MRVERRSAGAAGFGLARSGVADKVLEVVRLWAEVYWHGEMIGKVDKIRAVLVDTNEVQLGDWHGVVEFGEIVSEVVSSGENRRRAGLEIIIK
jgi:hypothetical protein